VGFYYAAASPALFGDQYFKGFGGFLLIHSTVSALSKWQTKGEFDTIPSHG
jgi:hypothetical protein